MSPLAATTHSALLAVLLALGSLLVPTSEAVAQTAAGGPTTLRERIKERWLARQHDKAAREVPPAESATGADTALDRPGDYNFSTLHDGLTRQYRIHVPRSYTATSPTALLVALHGGGGNMDYQASDENYGLISKSEAAGFVVVFPNGYSKLPSGKFATWNAGNCCGDARDRKVDDVGFVRQTLSELHRKLNLDHKRIYATGMSNGGMMAYRLACEMPDTFAAIAAVAGTDNTAACTPGMPISVLHIHARNDDRVLYNGGAGRKFGDASKVTDFTSVPATISKWVALNHCSPTPRRMLTTPGAYCERYAACNGGAQVQVCVTETGGHSWPGGHKARGTEAASQAISANDVMWDFFLSTPPPAVSPR